MSALIGVLRTSDRMAILAAARQEISWHDGWFRWFGEEFDVATGSRLGYLIQDGYLRVAEPGRAYSAIVPTSTGEAAFPAAEDAAR